MDAELRFCKSIRLPTLSLMSSSKGLAVVEIDPSSIRVISFKTFSVFWLNNLELFYNKEKGDFIYNFKNIPVAPWQLLGHLRFSP